MGTREGGRGRRRQVPLSGRRGEGRDLGKEEGKSTPKCYVL